VCAPEAFFFGTTDDEKVAQDEMDLVLCYMEMGRVPHPKTMESIKMMGKYVIPYFKGCTSWYGQQGRTTR
jgi:hypothetical protein